MTSVLSIIDERTKKIVNGYIHQIEHIFHDIYIHNIIPVGIVNLCTLFYFQFIEEFSADLCAQNISLSSSNNDKLTIASKVNGSDEAWETMYGSIIVDSHLYPMSKMEWTIKICASQYLQFFMIGLMEYATNPIFDGYCFVSLSKSKFYAWMNSTQNTWHQLKNNDYDANVRILRGKIANNQDTNMLMTNQDNILKLVLNTKQKTIAYYGNSIAYSKMFDNIDVSRKYRLAICVYNKNTVIEIVNFRISDL